MTPDPLVSIMVPVFNTERYVAETLRALIAQTYRHIEIIVVDDGSTDRSVKILKALANTDARIHLTVRENRGIVATRNEMLALAKGELLAVNDADDVSYPDRIEKQVRYLQQQPAVVCIGTYFELIDPAGRLLRCLRPPVDDARIQHTAIKGDSPLCHSSAMFRRSAIERVQGYTPELKLAHDLDLWLKLGEIGPIHNIPEPLVRFRLHNKSVSETRRYEQRDFAKKACEAAWLRRGIVGQFTAIAPWRPGEDADSRFTYAMRYGWWAFRSGERRTAVRYGLRALARKPFDREVWRLLVCAVIKPTPPDPDSQ